MPCEPCHLYISIMHKTCNSDNLYLTSCVHEQKEHGLLVGKVNGHGYDDQDEKILLVMLADRSEHFEALSSQLFADFD